MTAFKSPTRLAAVLAGVFGAVLGAAAPAPAAAPAVQVAIKPVETGTFTDRLEPVLEWPTSEWAAATCYARQDNSAVTIGNGFLELQVPKGLTGPTLVNKTTGEKVALPGPLVRAEVAAGQETGWLETPALADVKVGLDGAEGAASATITGTWPGLAVAIRLEVRRDEAVVRLRPTFTNTGAADVVIRELAFPWPAAEAVEFVSFHRVRTPLGGCFADVEFPFIGRRTLGYLPGWTVKPKETFVSESVAMVVYRNHNGAPDAAANAQGLWDWSMAYVRSITPVRRELIAHHQSYTGGGDPAPDDFALYKALGIRSHMSGCANWATKPEFRSPEGFWSEGARRENFAKLAERCQAEGLDLTAWAGCEKLFDCMASPQAAAFETWLLALVKRYHLTGMEFDVLGSRPGGCTAAAHGHLGGAYGTYAQARAWYDFIDQLRAATGNGLLAHHGGEFCQMYAQTRYDLCHTGNDPMNSIPLPTVSLDHAFADFHRLYMLGGLLGPAGRTAPYRLYVEIGHSGATSPAAFDVRGWRYSMVNTVAMTPTLIFMQVHGMPESEVRFTREWVDWARANRDYLLVHGRPLFASIDRTIHVNTRTTQSGLGVVGFNHIRGDRGFFALHNATFRPQAVDLEIGIDAEPPGLLVVQQIYPRVEQPIPGPESQAFRKGSHLRLSLPPRSVRLFKIGPPEFIGERLMYAGTVEQVVDAQAGLYLGTWRVVSAADGQVRLATTFAAPSPLRKCLADKAAWPAPSPKAPFTDLAPYLVPLLGPEGSLKPPGGLAIEAIVNGRRQTVVPFTIGHQFYYALRLDDLNADGENTLELSLPDRAGLVFRGCYLDVPDRYRE